MRKCLVVALACACALIAIALPVSAQEPEDPFETARFRMGPIRFTPTLEITSFGRDTNVFNEAEDPKSDTTGGVGPGLRVWMRPGPTRFSGTFGAQYLYFRRYDDQRAWNFNNEARWEVPLGRLTPFIGGRYVNSRERQGYEIDARSRRRDDEVSLGVDLRLTGRASLVATAERLNVAYDERETFLGAALAEQLNRREESAELQLRYVLTPLTTFVVRTELLRDRFETAVLKDSNSLRIMPGFDLKPFALISGEVFVGYRQLEPLDAAVPVYRGIAAAVKATYVRGATRFTGTVDRDLAYSYSPTRPYYALLDTGIEVTHRLPSPFELVGRAGRQVLTYRRISSAEPIGDPRDHGHVVGGGVGYRIGEALRLGADVNYATRRSGLERRNFEGLRVFGSLTYGLQQ